jgi:C_GCAxxG_C_C family probable redox protein
MSHAEKAVADYIATFNSAQSVLRAYCQELGLDRETAAKLSSGFGDGMASLGETCGAVTGAFMVLGLKYGRMKVDSMQGKVATNGLILEFTKRFKAKNGSINCRQLMGCDISTMDGRKEASEKGLRRKRCAVLIADTAEILDDLLKKER